MNDLKEQAKTLLFEALTLIDIEALIRQKVQLVANTLKFDQEAIQLENFDEIALIGFGKASLEMGEAIEDLLGDKLTRGLLVANRRSHKSFHSKVLIAGHPTPNSTSIEAAQAIVSLVQGLSDRS